jgi:hypothetical protein
LLNHTSANQHSFWRFFFAPALLCLLQACTSTEHVIDAQYLSGTAAISPYDTSLHKRSIHIFDPIDLQPKILKQQLQQKVDHLFILIDNSPEMDAEYRDLSKRQYAEEILRRFNKSLPPIQLTGEVLQFSSGWSLMIDSLTLPSPDFDRAKVATILNLGKNFKPSKGATLAEAIDHLTEHLGQLPGRSAVVLITRWEMIDKSVVEAVARMRQKTIFAKGVTVSDNVSTWNGKYGDGACLYTIGVGNELSRARFDGIDVCGFSMTADRVAQPRDMAHFVERVLFSGPKDTDGDGIYDYKDICPNTLEDVIVDFNGCRRFTPNSHLILRKMEPVRD